MSKAGEKSLLGGEQRERPERPNRSDFGLSSGGSSRGIGRHNGHIAGHRWGRVSDAGTARATSVNQSTKIDRLLYPTLAYILLRLLLLDVWVLTEAETVNLLQVLQLFHLQAELFRSLCIRLHLAASPFLVGTATVLLLYWGKTWSTTIRTGAHTAILQHSNDNRQASGPAQIAPPATPPLPGHGHPSSAYIPPPASSDHVDLLCTSITLLEQHLHTASVIFTWQLRTDSTAVAERASSFHPAGKGGQQLNSTSPLRTPCVCTNGCLFYAAPYSFSSIITLLCRTPCVCTKRVSFSTPRPLLVLVADLPSSHYDTEYCYRRSSTRYSYEGEIKVAINWKCGRIHTAVLIISSCVSSVTLPRISKDKCTASDKTHM